MSSFLALNMFLQMQADQEKMGNNKVQLYLYISFFLDFFDHLKLLENGL